MTDSIVTLNNISKLTDEILRKLFTSQKPITLVREEGKKIIDKCDVINEQSEQNEIKYCIW